MFLAKLEHALSEFFFKYGKFVTRWTPLFLGIPLILSIVAASIMFSKFIPLPLERDTIYLYTPIYGQATQDKENLAANFPVSDDNKWFAWRRFDLEWMGFVIVTRKDNGSVVDENLIFEVINIWSNLLDVMIYDYGDNFVYNDLCVQLPMQLPDKYCLQNPMMLLIYNRPQLLPTITYPSYVIPAALPSDPADEFRTIFLGNVLGGVKTDENGTITHADAIMMPYQLKRNHWMTRDLAEKWEVKLNGYLQGIDHPKIEVSWWTYETMVTETRKEMKKVILLMNPLFLIVTVFTVITSITRSPVRSKPWLALGGCISAFEGIGVAITLVLLCGRPFTSVAFFMPFIVFSIGVDDIYVLLAAWRRTPTKCSVETRMAEMLREAGVSITVTSLTDILSFGIGCISDFPAVKYFCMYAAVATTMVYIFQMTFLLAIFVYSGKREAQGRSAFSCSVQPSYTSSYSGRETALATDEDSIENDHPVAKFFRGPYASFLLKTWVKVVILSTYILLLLGAIAGLVRHVKVGLNPINVLPSDSYAKRTIEYQNKYFYEYQDYLHVWFTDLDDRPWDENLMLDLEGALSEFENTSFTGMASRNWIRDLRRFMQRANASSPGAIDELLYETIPYDGNITDPSVPTPAPHKRMRSIPEIVGAYFANPAIDGSYPEYQLDIKYSEDWTRLKATRFLVQLKHFIFPTHGEAMDLLQGIAARSKLNARAFHDFFLFATQIDRIIPSLLTNLGIAVGAVVLVTLLFIPDPTCSIWVCLNIASILTFMIGYGSLWGVTLDFASMITIVMSIGFCVDFSAHVAYHFATDSSGTTEGRLRGTLDAMGMPILQSAVSTMMGVSILAVIENYVGYSFIKMIVLAAFCGALHGLTVLPVVLTLLSCHCCKTTKVFNRDEPPTHREAMHLQHWNGK